MISNSSIFYSQETKLQDKCWLYGKHFIPLQAEKRNKTTT